MNIKHWTDEKLCTLLDKYGVDINYDNSMLLACIACGESHSVREYININLFLRMGANPHLIMDDDLICFDTSIEIKIYLDAIFKSFGYKCKWKDGTKNMKLEKMLEDARIDISDSEED